MINIKYPLLPHLEAMDCQIEDCRDEFIYVRFRKRADREAIITLLMLFKIPYATGMRTDEMSCHVYTMFIGQQGTR